MRARILSALKIQTGEAPLIGLLVVMMSLATAGSAAGGASIDALFFARFGVDSLPVWYIVLGAANFLNLILVAGLAGKVPRARLYRFLPLVLVAVLGIGRLLLALELRWFYPALYVGKEVINSLQGVFLWGLAGSLLDARQAKRLFPLFTAGGIAGTMLGSFSTPLLVNGFGAENMLVTWGLALAGTGLLCLALIRRNSARLAAQPGQPDGNQAEQGIGALFSEIRQGYRYVRGSSLMGWFALATLLFSVLWFSLLLPFSRLSTQQFPDANALAGFFGLFQGLWTVAALLVSLLLTGRLFARFGLIAMLAVYPLIYFAAFAVLSFFNLFPLIAGFRFVQLIWSQSVAETSWQATFNAVPAARRDQARAFMAAVPGQAGVVLSGLILLVGEQAFQPQQLYFLGLAAAAVCTWSLWRARRAYTAALTEALRTGQPQVFYTEEEPFGGFQRDPAAQAVLLNGLSSPDAGMRRLSAEILGRVPGQRVVAALVGGLDDPDAEVRAACLASLADVLADTPDVLLAIIQKAASCLSDPHADVRRQAVKTLQRLVHGDAARLSPLQPLLADADPAVRAQAASALLQAGETRPALSVLEELASHPDEAARIHALRSLGDCAACVDLSQVKKFLANGLRDASVTVRLAALEGLSSPPAEMGELLVRGLGDEDPAVCQGAAAALGRMGEPALPAVLGALEDGRLEDGALLALEGLPSHPAETRLQAYVSRKVARATSAHDHGRFQPRPGDAPAELLAESLRKEALLQAFRALRAFALLHERASITTAIQGLESRDPLQSAYAIEALDAAAAGESSQIRPLLRLWETGEDSAALPAPPLAALLDDPDAWLRACAALAARTNGGNPTPQITERLARLAQSDPDELVRAAAAAALPGGEAMQTLSTLSLMERILFLRRVPLFADLAPVDLKQVAAIGVERLYPDGVTITCQGDPGNELYIIVSGTVRVQTAEGKLIVNRKPGEYVGEMAIISQAPRMFSLVASGDTRLLCVGQKEFESILRQRPEVSLAVMRVLCDRLREQSG